MDGAGINQKILYGYAKAAKKLGEDFQLFRPTGNINPLQPGNLIGIVKVAATQNWSWMTSNKPGNPYWYLLVDGQSVSAPLSVQEDDYLVGDKIFFILSKDFQMPIQGCACNSVIHIKRPYQDMSNGLKPYSGYQNPDAALIIKNMPASILLMGRQGQKASSKLPTDTYQPIFMIQIPAIGDVDIRTGDIITQVPLSNLPAGDGGEMENYIVMVTEQSEFGWRITAQQVLN